METNSPTVSDFRTAIAELNQTYPRPELHLEVDELMFDVESQYAATFPNCDRPGVYALVSRNGTDVLRVGVAQNLGYRLGAYFKWSDRLTGKGVAKDFAYADVRFVLTVPLPSNRAFEAPSIESFLLFRLRPPLNTRLGLMEE
jgi:excinuclease UvrABC nuclease subunit